MGSSIATAVTEKLPECCAQTLSPHAKRTSELFDFVAANQYNDLIPLPNTLLYGKSSSSSSHSKSLSITLSFTSSVEPLESICQIEPDQHHKKNYGKKSRSNKSFNKKHLKKKRFPKSTRIYKKKNSKKRLESELFEAELTINQEKHEKDVLKKENILLREEYNKLRQIMLNKKVSVNSGNFGAVAGITPIYVQSPEHDTSSNITPIPLELYRSLSTGSVDNKYHQMISRFLNTKHQPNTNTNTNSPIEETFVIHDSVTPSSPGGPQLLAPTPVASIDLNNNNNINNIHNDDIYKFYNEYKCNLCIHECVGIKRIIIALKWYSKSGNDHHKIYKKMNHNNFGEHLLNDYNHIMNIHLNTSIMGNKDVRDEYKQICRKIRESLKECQFEPCSGYKRYLRQNKEGQGCLHSPRNSKQNESQIFVNIMDSIHVCFMHLANDIIR